jgi:predicted AlkP superfamily pyrophosphatase or phosphodiesterase
MTVRVLAAVGVVLGLAALSPVPLPAAAVRASALPSTRCPLPLAPCPADEAQAERPRLVVLLVIDQFRADYADWYGGQWTSGLKRLFTGGAVFTNAAFPYANTVTCPGHFSIGTGTVPAIHGMMNNSWYDRETRRSVACVTDQTAKSVAFGGAAGRETHSPRSARAPAFAEQLRAQATTAPHVVSVALKPRSAIGLAGRGGPNTAVVWEEDPGTWATSTAYATAPWPDVDDFVRSHPIEGDYGKIWQPLLPAERYLHLDDAPGESSPGTWSRTFPHPLIGPSGKPDNSFVTAWERSPYSDRYVTDLAIHLLERRGLGRAAGRTDFLALSLPALDLVGHEFGPRSHEVQDVLARADAGIGRLLAALDQQVGAGRYVLAFGSDHGVGLIPEQAREQGLDAGRVSTGEIRSAVNRVIGAALGSGTYVGAVIDSNISLTPGTYDRLRETSGAIEAVRSALAAVAGIERVYTADELAATTPTSDELLKRWRLSYVPGRSGEFIASPKARWIIRGGGGTTHGSPNDYDARVPVLFYGAGIRAGRHAVAASPTDIVPTLAAITGVTLAQASGRVLQEVWGR